MPTNNPQGKLEAPSGLSILAGSMGDPAAKLWAAMQLKADMFDYLCWLEQCQKPVELRDQFLCLASDGTTCWGKNYAEAVRVAMEHDKGIQDGKEEGE